jgi:hypothetical protein
MAKENFFTTAMSRDTREMTLDEKHNPDELIRHVRKRNHTYPN